MNLTSNQSDADILGMMRVRKTPCGFHPYTVRIKGLPEYGWGYTPDEARNCLLRYIRKRSAQSEIVNLITPNKKGNHV